MFVENKNDTWEWAHSQLNENIKYCKEREIPVCTINFNVFLERMTGFKNFLLEVMTSYPGTTYHVSTYYDNFNSSGNLRTAGHFMYYNITITVPLA